MGENNRPKRIVCFGAFRADLDSGELFKDGIKVHLPEQPFRLLSILLEVPGEVVSRDELRRRLWPEDTHVDFDRSLNTAASKLREALADGSGSSRDIETLPKRGYRFITPVSGVVHQPSPSERDEQKLRSRPILLSYVLWAAILLVSAFGLAYSYWHSTFRVPPIKRTVRLTNDDFTKSPELATDGPRLYFSAWKGERSVLAQVATAGGDTEVIPTPEIGADASACVRGVSPDKRNLLVVTGKQRVADEGHALWSVRVSPVSSRRVGSIMANDADWSPDGQKIVYATRNQIWICEADGTRPRKLAEQGGLTAYPRWSPDGQIIRFSKLAWDTFEQTIWEVTAGGGSAHRLFPNWPAEHWGGQWTSDGNYYVFNSESNIWAVSERPRWFRNVRTPVQLTFGPLTYYAPLPSTDGRTIYTVGEIRRGELLRYDREQSRFVPSFPGLSAEWVTFSNDGKSMAYQSYPKNELWRSRPDGSGRQQLTAAPMKIDGPRWSPDGRHLVFSGLRPGDIYRTYLIGAEGGTPKVVAAGKNIVDATWSPDGSRLVATEMTRGYPALIFVDLQTEKLSRAPGGDGFDEPRWSPDGRYIVAVRAASDSACMVFDLAKKTQFELGPPSCSWVVWTRDSSSFFCLEGKGGSIDRCDLATRKAQKEVTLRDLRIAGSPSWLGIMPDDSPLILKDVGSQEIYALEWRGK